MRTVLIAALVAAALPALGGAAQAQGYGYLPQPAYAYGGDSGGHGGRFTLAGARAGITVLGIDLDGSANLKIGIHGHHGGGGQAYYAPPPQPVYAPAPEYNSGGAGYVSAGYGQGYVQTYASQNYVQDYGGAAYGGGCAQCAPPPPPAPCGCNGGW